jgi:hypothetical protein
MHRFIDGEDRMQQALLPHSLPGDVDVKFNLAVIAGRRQPPVAAIFASARGLQSMLPNGPSVQALPVGGAERRGSAESGGYRLLKALPISGRDNSAGRIRPTPFAA